MSHEVFAGLIPVAKQIRDLGVSGIYTPTLTSSGTNPTLGTGSVQSGWWQRNGHHISGGAVIQFGTSGVAAGTGQYQILLPFEADLSALLVGGAGLASAVGWANLRDSSGASTTWIAGVCYLRDATHAEIQQGAGGLVSSSGPWPWAASDAISIGFNYLADPADLP